MCDGGIKAERFGVKQQPLKPETIKGIFWVTHRFLEQGLIGLCRSPCNTPVVYPLKSQGARKRFVQGLQAVNEATRHIHPVAPDPYILLTNLPSNSKYYTALYLKKAFFCCTLGSESQESFPFAWEDLASPPPRPAQDSNTAGLVYLKY